MSDARELIAGMWRGWLPSARYETADAIMQLCRDEALADRDAALAEAALLREGLRDALVLSQGLGGWDHLDYAEYSRLEALLANPATYAAKVVAVLDAVREWARIYDDPSETGSMWSQSRINLATAVRDLDAKGDSDQ